MTDEQVKQVIDAIMNGTLIDNWHFYIISFFVSLITISGFAFLKSYYTEKGKYTALELKLHLIEEQTNRIENGKFKAIHENLDTIKDQFITQEKAKYIAIEESLETIKQQVAITTETSEKIKVALDHDNWRKKELEIIKRKKLEEYYYLLSKLPESLSLHMGDVYYNEKKNYNKDIVDELDIIQALYLPELINEHHQVSLGIQEHRKCIVEVQKILLNQLKFSQPQEVPQENITHHENVLDELILPVFNARQKVTQFAAELNH